MLQQIFDNADQEENAAAVPMMNKNDQYDVESSNPDDRNTMPVGTMNATEG